MYADQTEHDLRNRLNSIKLCMLCLTTASPTPEEAAGWLAEVSEAAQACVDALDRADVTPAEDSCPGEREVGTSRAAA